jgi:hypothetical protein
MAPDFNEKCLYFRGKKSQILTNERFTKEERKKCALILKDIADSESIRVFCILLEDYCKNQYLIEKHETYEQQRFKMEELKKIIKSTQKLLKALQHIKSGVNFVMPYNVEEVQHSRIQPEIREKTRVDDPCFLFNKELLTKADCVIEPLLRFIETSQKIQLLYPMEKTKKQADKSGFVQAIGRIYLMYIGIPRTTRGGPFYSIVQLTVEYLELRCEFSKRANRKEETGIDPQRAILKALPALEKNYPDLYAHFYAYHKKLPIPQKK